MKILGIDYGRKKIGVAIAEGSLASPLKVLKSPFGEEIAEIIRAENIEKVVVGISEGEMANEAREFGEELLRKSGVPVEYEDETLSTHEAQRLSQEAHIKRSKRKAMEDAYSATLILQKYLDRS